MDAGPWPLAHGRAGGCWRFLPVSSTKRPSPSAAVSEEETAAFAPGFAPAGARKAGGRSSSVARPPACPGVEKGGDLGSCVPFPWMAVSPWEAVSGSSPIAPRGWWLRPGHRTGDRRSGPAGMGGVAASSWIGSSGGEGVRAPWESDGRSRTGSNQGGDTAARHTTDDEPLDGAGHRRPRSIDRFSRFVLSSAFPPGGVLVPARIGLPKAAPRAVRVPRGLGASRDSRGGKITDYGRPSEGIVPRFLEGSRPPRAAP